MRALPLYQPWASLVVDGVKRVETRPKPIRTLVGERIAIHATANEPLIARAAAVRAMIGAGVSLDLEAIPHGALVGTVRVVDCVEMTETWVEWMRLNSPREFALGNYAPGRWRFRLDDPRRFARPVPWKGSQGVFMVPDQVVRTAECERCSDGVITVPTSCFGSSLVPCPDCRLRDAAAFESRALSIVTGLT